MTMLHRLWQDEDGQGLVEYGLIVALISVALITALTAMKGALWGDNSSVFNTIIDKLKNAVG